MPTVASKHKRSGGVVLGALITLYERRWLLTYFVQRQLSRSYRGSFLGFLWVFLSPLLMIALYTVVFSEIIGIRFQEVEGNSSLNFGLYVYCGLVPFLAFSEAINQSASSIKSNANLVQKVVFPLEILPLSAAVTTLVDKLFGLGVLVVVVALLEHQLHATLLLLPLVILPQVVFILGLSYLAAVAGAYAPDIREVLRALLRAMLFVTPIIWPPEIVPENLRFVVDYNPLAFLVGAYRDMILNGEVPDGGSLLWFSLLAGALMVVGFVVFVRVKQRFADLI